MATAQVPVRLAPHGRLLRPAAAAPKVTPLLAAPPPPWDDPPNLDDNATQQRSETRSLPKRKRHRKRSTSSSSSSRRDRRRRRRSSRRRSRRRSSRARNQNQPSKTAATHSDVFQMNSPLHALPAPPTADSAFPPATAAVLPFQDSQPPFRSAKQRGRSRRRRRRSSSSPTRSRSPRRSPLANSVFREAVPLHSHSQQAELISYSQKNPGKLASELLLTMQRQIGLSAEVHQQPSSTATPPIASAYLLRCLTPPYPNMRYRDAPELTTLSTILDHLAQGHSGQAADIVAQRIKTLALTQEDSGNYDAAKHLELIPPRQEGLVTLGERHMVLKESKLHKGAQLAPPPPNNQWKSKGKGTLQLDNKGSKGKTKHPKGKGKMRWKGAKGPLNVWGDANKVDR